MSNEKGLPIILESVLVGIPLHYKYFKNDQCPVGKDCLFMHAQKKNRSTSPKGKGIGKSLKKKR